MISTPAILVLEDERAQLLALRAALKGIGEIKEFDDPTLALRFLKENVVDVAIIDVHMPRFRMDGMGFVNAVRAFDVDLSIILRTGDDSTELADSAIEARVFRRVIKGRTDVDQLRAMTAAAVNATRTRRQIAIDAANTEDARSQLVETLGSVEEEHLATDSYKQLIRDLRNRLTEAVGNAEIMHRMSESSSDKALQRAADRNKSSLVAMIERLNSFLNHPYAESLRSTDVSNRTTANGLMDALERRFSTSPKWNANRRPVQFKALSQDVFISAQPLRLLAALRHLVEYVLSLAPTDAEVTFEASHREKVLTGAQAMEKPSFRFGDLETIQRNAHLRFHLVAVNTRCDVKELVAAFENSPKDPREANLQMLTSAVRAEGFGLQIRIGPSLLTFEVLLPIYR